MRIATVSRIPVRLHWSFLALVALYGMWAFRDGGLAGLAMTAIVAGMLFGSVVLHELGHALTARMFGIGTAHITLYPFGGVAAIKGEPRGPMQEFLIAVAGPAVNFALFALLVPAWLAFGGTALVTAAAINLIMGVFNLLPAFPMDGGRILRAALTPVLGFWRASSAAILIGRLFAGLFIAVGVVTFTMSLLLVGAFLLFATFIEARRLRYLRAHASPYGRRAAPRRVASVGDWRLNPPRGDHWTMPSR